MTHKKIWASLLIVMVLLFPVRRSDAVIPLLAAWLLTIGGDAILITDLGFGITGLLSGAIWYDCNKFSLSGVCNNKPASMPASSAPPAVMTVNLTPDAKRINPDPKKFDGPAPGKKDVTPKQKIASNPAPAPAPPVPPSSPSAPINAGTFAGTAAQQYLGNDENVNWMFNQSHSRGDAVMMAVLTFSGVNWPLSQNVPVVFQSFVCPISADEPQRSKDLAACNTYQQKYDALKTAYPGQTNNVMKCMADVPTVMCVVMVIEFSHSLAASSTCDPGYKLADDGCTLTDTALVQKPSSTPCEVLYDTASNTMSADSLNPNCAGQVSINGSNLTAKSTTDQTQLNINPNAAGGFDVTKTNADGTSLTASTGPYDSVGKGYPITGTKSGNGKDPNGASCGVAGLPACQVSMSIDSLTQGTQAGAQSGITNGVGSLQGTVNSINDTQFVWNFIPRIPSAKCVDPSIRNPLNDSTVSMPICSAFNGLNFFINCVFGVICLFGVKQQVDAALKA